MPYYIRRQGKMPCKNPRKIQCATKDGVARPPPPFLSPVPVPTSTLALTRTRRRQLLSLHSLARRGLPGSRPTSGYPALPDAGLEQRGSSPYRQMHARAWHHVHQQRHTNMQGLQSALRVPNWRCARATFVVTSLPRIPRFDRVAVFRYGAHFR